MYNGRLIGKKVPEPTITKTSGMRDIREHYINNLDGSWPKTYIESEWSPQSVLSLNEFRGTLPSGSSNPSHIITSQDGSKIYTNLYSTTQFLYQHNLTVPYDFSTAQTGQSVDLGDFLDNPSSIQIDPTGEKMFVLCDTGQAVYSYALSTPWDISTLTMNGRSTVSTPPTPGGVCYGNNGTKFYAVSTTTDYLVYEYNLSTAYDTTTATFVTSVNMSSVITSILDIQISNDGKILYLSNASGINEAILSTPWSIASFVSVDDGIPLSDDSDMRGIQVSPSGTTIIMIGNTSDRLYEYSVETPYDIRTRSLVTSVLVSSFGITTVDDMSFGNNGSYLYLCQTSNRTVYQFELVTPYSLTGGINFIKSKSYVDYTSLFFAITFTPDGTQMITHNYTNDRLVSYTLAIPWDIDTSQPPVISNNIIDNALYSMQFNNNGTQLYVGRNSTSIFVVNLSIPYDITSMTAAASGITAGNVAIRSFFVSNDGQYMAIITTGNLFKVQYLTTPYSFSTYVNAGRYTIANTGFDFSSDGTYLYTVNGSVNSVLIRTPLNYPYRLETAIPSSAISTAYPTYSSNPRKIRITDNDNKIYIKYDNFLVQYNLSNPNDLLNYTAIGSLRNFVVSTGFDVSDDGTDFVDVANTTGLTPFFHGIMYTAYNILTANYKSAKSLFEQTGAISSSSHIKVSEDGSKLYALNGSSIYQYSITTPWDITTCNYENKFKNIGTTGYGIEITPDGEYLFFLSSTNIIKRRMTTPYDIETLEDINTNEYPHYEGTSIRGLNFSDNGTYLNMMEIGRDRALTFKMTTPYDITDPLTYVESKSLFSSRSFSVDRNNKYIVNLRSTGIYINEMTVPSVISTINDTHTSSLLLSIAGDSVYIPYNRPDRLFYENPSSTISELQLTKYFNLENLSTLDISSGGPTSNDFIFNKDGSKYYRLLDSASDSIIQYSCITPFATFGVTQDTSVTISFVSSPSAFIFNNTGTEIYIIDNTNRLHKFKLSTPWDFRGTFFHSGYVTLSNIPSSISSTKCLRISEDGKIFYVLSAGILYKYNIRS